jgi:ABC-type multidrug transport system ATPase subunit
MARRTITAYDNIVDGDVTRVSLRWENLCYKAVTIDKTTGEKKETEFLHSANGMANAGDYISIMGPSGAGKTTLMNILANRIRKADTAIIEGSIYANGAHIGSVAYNNYVGYVTQDDILLDTMTVRECIQFSVDLRTTLPPESKAQKVDKVLDELHLKRVQNNIIGSSLIKGISGGEKKRTAIAVELITNPSVLFLDEPTSGLDSFTSQSVVKLLNTLASQGRTIISTIHQPNSEMFTLFDKLILVCDGYVVYQGPAKDAVGYFEKVGYACPSLSNPADYFMEILHFKNKREKSPEEEKRLEIFKNAQLAIRNELEDRMKDARSNSVSMPQLVQEVTKRKTSFYYQLYRCTQRNYHDLLRNPKLFKAKGAIMIIMGGIVLCVYHDLGDEDISDANNRAGLLFFCVVHVIMTQINAIVTTCKL